MALDYYYSHKKKDDEKAGQRARPPQILVEQKEEHRRQEFVIDYRRLTWVVLGVALMTLMWWLFLSPTFVVKDIIYDQEPSPSIKQKIEALRGKNIFLLRFSAFEQEWEKEQPIIKNLRLYRGLPNTLRVTVEERSKALVWKSGDHYYLLDATGVAYEDLGKKSKEKYLPIIDDRNVPVSLGERAVSNDFVTSVQKIIDSLSGKIGNESISEVHIGESTFNVDIKTSQNITLKFDILQPIDLQIEALEFVYKEKRSDVHKYVDVRVIGKAYIK